MSERDEKSSATGYAPPDAPVTIRIDGKAAQAVLTAGQHRQMLVWALREHAAGKHSGAVRREWEAREARLDTLRHALALVTVEIGNLTSPSEAAATLAVYANAMQSLSENRPKRGRPKQLGPTSEEVRVATVIDTVKKHRPQTTDAELVDEITKMVLEGKANIGKPVHAPEYSGAIKKRIQRARKRVQAAKT